MGVRSIWPERISTFGGGVRYCWDTIPLPGSQAVGLFISNQPENNRRRCPPLRVDNIENIAPLLLTKMADYKCRQQSPSSKPDWRSPEGWHLDSPSRASSLQESVSKSNGKPPLHERSALTLPTMEIETGHNNPGEQGGLHTWEETSRSVY